MRRTRTDLRQTHRSCGWKVSPLSANRHRLRDLLAPMQYYWVTAQAAHAYVESRQAFGRVLRIP